MGLRVGEDGSLLVVRKTLKDEIVTKWGQSSNQTEEGRQNTDVTATQTGKQTDKHTFRNT